MTSPTEPTSPTQLISAICALLPVVLKREVSGADADTELLDALGLNSTTGLELVLELEERLGLEISVEDLGRDDFTTVGSLAAYVADHLLADA
ncbi:phosphopantetheine-binding protein [Kitasatospora sp. NPDC001540]|uniref:phosphopantetheine-binding protein n=1 Tax=Kitasatospora sp. NPDC001540 TaxID=3364014 RepID=UPI00367D4894